jgi:hypothetical protein
MSRRRTKLGGSALTENYVITVRLPVGSDHVLYLRLFQSFLFYLQTSRWNTQSKKKQKKKNDTTMNNRSKNLNGSNMYDLWVIK